MPFDRLFRRQETIHLDAKSPFRPFGCDVVPVIQPRQVNAAEQLSVSCR